MERFAMLLLALLLGAVPGPGTESGPWMPPVAGGTGVGRGFDPPEEPWLPGHRGVDLAAEPGDPIHAAGPGRVHFAGDVAGTPVVSVSHGVLRTTYLPVVAEVSQGEPVEAGDPLGTLAERPRHCPDRPCLHWGLLRGGEYLDPLSLLGRGEIRLLPPRCAALCRGRG
jgi:murein DD-endopeptidase MepM/ murein hydrolase activator NlpD